MKVKTPILRILLVTLALAFSFVAHGQTPVIGENKTVQVEELRREIDLVVTSISESLEADDKLAELALKLQDLEKQAVAIGVEISPRLSVIKTRLDQLGPVPGENEPPEPDTIAAERAVLVEERARINQLLGTLEDQSIRTKTLTDQIAEARRELFANALSRRYDITSAFGSSLLTDVADHWNTLSRRITSWLDFSWRVKPNAILGSVAGLLLLALLAYAGARRGFGTLLNRDPTRLEPGYFNRLTVAFWYTLLPSVVFGVMLTIGYWLMHWLGIMRQDIALLIGTLIGAAGILFLIWRLAEAIFAPRLPNWRLLDITDKAARALKFIVITMALVAVSDAIITQVNTIIGTSVPITIAKSLLTAVLVGVLLVMIGLVRPFAGSDGQNMPWPRWARALFVGVGILLVITALAGYIGLARFVAQQIVVTGALLTTMYLGQRAAHATTQEKVLQGTRIGRYLTQEMGLSETGLDQFGLAAGMALTFLVLAVGIPALALLWGFQWVEVQALAFRFFTDIKIGSIHISLASIFAGIGIFFFGYWLTKRFQNWIDGNVLERSRVETGARNSIRTAIGYVGVAIAGLVGVSAAGIDLSQLALVAGALSLGIGFGLQNIVSNFVSGLILLAERPFKSGDIIESGGLVGTVRTISVRATEVETFDRKTLILPNSELINSAVTNWVHKSTLGRIEIPVGVSYDSDPQVVHDMLLEIVQDHPRILANPEPFVAFESFGDSSLDFIVRGYLADIGFAVAVRTELRIAIWRRFRDAGIEIPFPQRDVNLKVMDGNISQILPESAGEQNYPVIKTSKSKHLDDDI